MEHLWDDAIQGSDALSDFFYAARLLGAEPELGLPGTCSISVKLTQPDLLGKEQQTLLISGREQDLATFSAQDFAPLRRAPLVDLLELDALTADQLDNELLCQRTRADAPLASADALIHAGLPDACIAITRPAALLAMASTPSAAEHVAETYRAAVAYVKSETSNLALAQATVRARDASPSLLGIMTSDGRLIVFGENARQVYDRIFELVDRAQGYLDEQKAWDIAAPPVSPPDVPHRQARAAQRRALAEQAGHPLIVSALMDSLSLAFAQREDCPTLVQRILGNAAADSGVVFDPEVGLSVSGDTAEQAAWRGEAWRRRTMASLRAMALEKYVPQPAPSISSKPGLFAGQVALVTGAASGIGKACVESLLARGAAVAGLDISPNIVGLFPQAGFLGAVCDVADETAVVQAFEAVATQFGGLDMLVLNAGVFPASTPIDGLTLAEWDRVMRVNLDANVTMMREAYPLLKQSPAGGRVVINASKNVRAPGAGAAAYSASKAALTQLGRVAALEWAQDHIRVNIIHPDQVFDTGIWTEEVLQARAAHYGLTVEQYKTRNLLGTELNSHYVAEVIAEMLGPLFEKITGAQLPVDGGSDRVV